MKRPIAEFIKMTLKPGAEAERAQHEQEAWQILRRKPGYVTHRVYRHIEDPLQRLVYSEWESAKAVDGARQYLQGTALMRRARAALATAPQRWTVELVGPITSTKGLDLADRAVAAYAATRLEGDSTAWRELEDKVWKTLSGQPGHITHLLFRGFEDALAVGSFSHWADADALTQALARVDDAAPEARARPSSCTLYQMVHD